MSPGCTRASRCLGVASSNRRSADRTQAVARSAFSSRAGPPRAGWRAPGPPASRGGVAVAAHHGLGREERVHDRLLGRLDRGAEQPRIRSPAAPGAVDARRAGASVRRRTGEPVRRRERDASARRSRSRRSEPPRARPIPARSAIRRSWCGSSGASVATTTTHEPSECSTGIRSSIASPTRHAVDQQVAPARRGS